MNLVILADMKAVLKTDKERAASAMGRDQHYGNLYPSACTEAGFITEPKRLYSVCQRRLGRSGHPPDNGQLCSPTYIRRHAQLPVKHSLIGLFADLRRCHDTDGPELFVGEDYIPCAVRSLRSQPAALEILLEIRTRIFHSTGTKHGRGNVC